MTGEIDRLYDQMETLDQKIDALAAKTDKRIAELFEIAAEIKQSAAVIASQRETLGRLTLFTSYAIVSILSAVVGGVVANWIR